MTSKTVPEKVTDVKFSFKKGGEFTMTNQSSLERSPAEWGTVKFISEELDSLQQNDGLVSSSKQSISQKLTTEKAPDIGKTSDLSPSIDNETRTKLSTISVETGETGSKAVLAAHRDQSDHRDSKKLHKTY